MKKNSSKRAGRSIMKLLTLYVIVLSIFLMQQTLADDTDIYLSPEGGGSAPLVMLSLDYHSNMGSSKCNDSDPALGCGFLATECDGSKPKYIGVESSLDDLDDSRDIEFEDGSIDFAGDGDIIPDVRKKFICTRQDINIFDSFTFLDLLRAAIRYVFYDKEGIKLGVMMSHADSTTGKKCVGPAYSGTDSDCSNGGFILQHLTDMTVPDGKSYFTAMKDGIGFEAVYKPLHLLKPKDETTTGSGHPYQGAELFFELYRYLTGREVYNGHVGFTEQENSLIRPFVGAVENTIKFNWDIGAEDAGYVDDGLFNNKADPNSENYKTDHTYISPITHQCSKISTMNFLFQVSLQDYNSKSAIEASYSSGGLDMDLSTNDTFNDVIRKLNLIDLGDGNHNHIGGIDDYDDDFNINVNSYFYVDGKGNKEDAVRKVNNYAVSGGTVEARVISDNVSAFVGALENDLKEVLSVSSTFVSSSVPVNVFNRAELIDNVYMAIFEAEETLKPAWLGNLKRLELDLSANKIVDVEGIGAFGVNGKIRRSALTFWTEKTDIHLPKSNDELTTKDEPNPEYNKDADIGVDGRAVSLGGAGSKIPGYLVTGDITTRKLYTEPDSCTPTPCALMEIKATSTTARDLWTSLNRTTHRASGNLVNASAWSGLVWQDVLDNNGDPTGEVELAPQNPDDPDSVDAASVDTAEAIKVLEFMQGIDAAADDGARPWLLGDPMHSRPFPLNYGATTSGYSETNPDIRILMGSNDGYLRMFLNSNDNGTPNGKELWAFMPREVMAIQKRLMDNTKTVGSIIHPYGLDGTPVVYARDGNNNNTLGDVGDADPKVHDDKVQVFFGLRRGGKSYYALDITDPDIPKFKWKISKTNGGDFDNLGMTFSIPKLAKLRYFGKLEEEDSTTKWQNVVALIFAGGYDANKDARTGEVGTSDGEGNAIYIVNADTGYLIKSFTKYRKSDGTDDFFTDSMPSAVSALDTDQDGSVDRIYVGDTGGNVWRVDLPIGVIAKDDVQPADDTSYWFAHKFAALGRHGVSDATTDDRRFFHKPDIVLTRDEGGQFDAVIIGSGNRANPKGSGYSDNQEPANRLFMLKDRNLGVVNYKITPPPAAALTTGDSSDPDDLGDLGDVTTCSKTNSCTVDISNGWYIDLESDDEKILSTPLTLAGSIFANTYIPSGGACGPAEGTGYLYALKLSNATSANIDFHLSSDEDSKKESNERIYELGAGIPASPVAVGDGKILLPGGKIVKAGDQDDGLSYWYESRQ